TQYDPYQAFIYQNGRITDLNSLINSGSGWKLWNATAINNAGQIAGIGEGPHGGPDFFLLTPVEAPEPGSLMLLATGAFSLGGYVWRKRRRNRLPCSAPCPVPTPAQATAPSPHPCRGSAC